MIKASRQGDLDTLCGYYAFHNVMKLLNPKAGLDDDDFGHWIDIVGEAGHPNGARDCLSRPGLLHLAKGAQDSKVVGGTFDFETPWWGSTPTLDEFWGRAAEHVNDGGFAIVAFFPDSWEHGHWSVVREATNATMHLQDSAEVRQMRRHLCRVGSAFATHARRPWRLEASSTFLFRRADA